VHGSNQFRAHPNYQSSGPWYDWVEVKYRITSNNKGKEHTGMFPSKILCFFHDPITGEMMSLVHSCECKTKDQWSSVLCQEWFLKYCNQEVYTRECQEQKQRKRVSTTLKAPTIRAVPIKSFGKPLYVIEEHPGLVESVIPSEKPDYNRCIVIKSPVSTWISEFTSNYIYP